LSMNVCSWRVDFETRASAIRVFLDPYVAFSLEVTHARIRRGLLIVPKAGRLAIESPQWKGQKRHNACKCRHRQTDRCSRCVPVSPNHSYPFNSVVVGGVLAAGAKTVKGGNRLSLDKILAIA